MFVVGICFCKLKVEQVIPQVDEFWQRTYQNQSCNTDWVSHSLHDQAHHGIAALIHNKVSLPQEAQSGWQRCGSRDGQSQNQPS